MQPNHVLGEVRPRGWWVVAVSSVGISSNPGQFAFGAIGLFIIPLAAEFGWQRTEISFALTVFTLALAVSMPVIGRLVDRFGARTILLPSTIVFGLLLGSIALIVSHLWQLWFIFLLIGTFGAGANSLPYLRIIGAWFDRHRGLAFGVAMAGGGLGYTYVPPLVQYLIDQYGWRYGYYTLAGIVLFIVVPLIAMFVREPSQPPGSQVRPGSSATHQENTQGETIGPATLFRHRIFWILFAVFMLLSLSLFGLLSHFVPMLVDRGMPAERAALVASSLGATIIASRAVIGWLIDRYFAPRVASVCIIVSAIGLALLATGAVGPAAYLAAVLVGMSIGAEIDLLAFLASRYFDLRSFGFVYGALFSAFLIGSATGPVLYGAGFDTTGSYVTVLAGCVGMLLLAVLALQLLPAYKQPAAGDAPPADKNTG